MKKTVVVDMSHIGTFCGFGEIAKNYGPRLAKLKFPDMRIIMMVPEKHLGVFGDEAEYIRKEHVRDDIKKIGGQIDLWHATDQQYRYRYMKKGTIQLLTVHDLNYLYEKKGLHRLRHVFQMRHRVKNSDYITCISKHVQRELLANVHQASSKPISIIYNGIQDTTKSPKEKPAFVANPDEKFFFSIGQIREKKNFQKLVPMMHYFPGYKLYICGDDHFAYAQTLRELIAQVGENRVFLVGKVTDPEKNWLYAHAAAYFFPSRLEGFGIPGLEAMRFGCRVYASKLGSLPEVYENQACYWDSLEPEAMADVIRKDYPEWKKHPEKAEQAKIFSEQYNYDTYTQNYITLYRKLLGLTSE